MTVAVVTGGAQGIGRAISLELLSGGHRVVALDIDTEAGGELATETNALFVRADVSQPESVAHAFGEVLERTGRIDALVNNAGIASPARVPIEHADYRDFRRVIATNLDSVFLCSRAAARELRARRGAIVNIASTRALQSEPHTEAYAASKGGIVALTHALAVSLGPDVRVNCVSPGWIEVSELKKRAARRSAKLSAEDHAQHPAGRVGRGEDVAKLVAFLLSEAAGFITGQNFVADGGMTKKMIYAE